MTDRFLIIWTPFWFISVFESSAYLKFAELCMFPLAFVAGSLQGPWWGFISRNYVVWPIYFLMNVFIALKGTHFFLFAFTAAGVVKCGGRKTSPRTSTIVQFIFYFWSFEISVNILRNQTWMIGLYSYSRQVFNYLDPILIYINLWIECLFWKSQNCNMSPLAFVVGSLQGHRWGFISPNYIVWPIFFLMNVFIALKGTHFFIFYLYCYSFHETVPRPCRFRIPNSI